MYRCGIASNIPQNKKTTRQIQNYLLLPNWCITGLSTIYKNAFRSYDSDCNPSVALKFTTAELFLSTVATERRLLIIVPISSAALSNFCSDFRTILKVSADRAPLLFKLLFGDSVADGLTVTPANLDLKVTNMNSRNQELTHIHTAI